MKFSPLAVPGQLLVWWRVPDFVVVVSLALGVIGGVSEAAQSGAEPDQITIETMRSAFHANDLSGFMEALVLNALGMSLFERHSDAFDILCQAAALDEREHFMDALLAAGLDPNTRFRSDEKVSGSLLRCAASLGNDSAFAGLITAGARTADPQCVSCEGDGRFTLILHSQRWPKIVDLIVDDRPLKESEIRDLASITETKVIRGTHKGLPTNVYYAKLLAEMGVDVVPATQEPASD